VIGATTLIYTNAYMELMTEIMALWIFTNEFSKKRCSGN
jgi:hypothetical protein